jgi:hypothetical protein
MSGCCSAGRKAEKITVKFLDGSVKTYATRPEAVAAVTRAGGGTIRGA